jgi:hypothetical protein
MGSGLMCGVFPDSRQLNIDDGWKLTIDQFDVIPVFHSHHGLEDLLIGQLRASNPHGIHHCLGPVLGYERSKDILGNVGGHGNEKGKIVNLPFFLRCAQLVN